MVECHLAKVDVEGSNPFSRSTRRFAPRGASWHADRTPVRMNRTTRANPTVGDVMTMTPRTIEANQPIVAARRIMREYGVRHLPVVDDRGRLVGVISERDIHVAQVASADRMMVEEIMAAKPYAVAPNLLLQQVVRNMAAKKLGSAVVMDHGRVLGVFTTTDALDVLADALEGKLVRLQAEVDVRRRPVRGRTRRIGREALL